MVWRLTSVFYLYSQIYGVHQKEWGKESQFKITY